MRTTIDLPDPLFQRAKMAALQRRQSLKQLVTEILESALAPDEGAKRMTRPPIRLNLVQPIPALTNQQIAEILDNEDSSVLSANTR